MTPKPWSNTPLNLEEFYEAIEDARKRKWFKERSKDYWTSQEVPSKKNSRKVVKDIAKN
jgi:hypothetical protein